MHPAPRLVRLALVAIVVGLVAASAAGVQPHRPNIVLIVSDDHGTDALGCYSNPVVRTPHLDALASDGTRFTHAFCTSASCSPSRSVLLTGQQNHRNGMYGLQHQDHHFQSFDTVKGLPLRLAEAGYRTARIGKFHLAPEPAYAFQTVLSGGAANDPESLGRNPVAMAEQTHAFLAASDARPFFLYFATDDPHRANGVLPSGKPTFDTYPEPNRFGNREGGYPGVEEVLFDPAKVVVPPYLPDTLTCRQELAQYYQSVARLDQGIGRLIRLLKETGHYENSVIVYLSDNGAAFPGAKTTLYEPGIRLPLLVRVPGRTRPGSVQEAMVSWVDVTPTLLDVAGVWSADWASEFDGRSFRAALDGAKVTGWDEVYGSHSLHEITMYYPMRMVRTRRYKLIHNVASGLPFPFALDLIQAPTWVDLERRGIATYGPRTIEQFRRRPAFELYDLVADPDEVKNLADDLAFAAVREELIGMVRQFQERTRDPWRHKWRYE
jgi:N-sulfoglucosamine sulfohydrolase